MKMSNLLALVLVPIVSACATAPSPSHSLTSVPKLLRKPVAAVSLPAESQAFLDKYSSRITKLYVSGGTSAVDDATVTAATTVSQTISESVAAARNSGVTTSVTLRVVRP